MEPATNNYLNNYNWMVRPPPSLDTMWVCGVFFITRVPCHFFGILEDIVEIFDVPVDLIEASQIIEGSRVQHEINETGIIIYERA